jgi:multidrug efflux pump subunit AcrA (membrane-fusion protein)
MTLPQSAVLLRDGFSYVLRVGPDSRVVQTKVTVGRRIDDRVEIVGGIDAASAVVVAGGGFLGDGDLVRVAADLPALSPDPIASASEPSPSHGQLSGAPK